MKRDDLEELVCLLKCGEYDGTNIMQAWIAIEELVRQKDELVNSVNNFLSDPHNDEFAEDIWITLQDSIKCF